MVLKSLIHAITSNNKSWVVSETPSGACGRRMPKILHRSKGEHRRRVVEAGANLPPAQDQGRTNVVNPQGTRVASGKLSHKLWTITMFHGKIHEKNTIHH